MEFSPELKRKFVEMDIKRRLPVLIELLSNVYEKATEAMLDNMQYYMEYCQNNPYITPKEWLETKKHF